MVIRWSSAEGKYYRLDRCTNLLTPLAFGFNVRPNIPAIPPMNTVTDQTAAGRGQSFYRIELE